MPADHATRRRSDAAHHQALRFLAVGATTVVIDFVVYQGLHLIDVPLTPAKALSFIVATVCAYFFNRAFTFGASGGRRSAITFSLLYGVTLVVNVSVNAVALYLLPRSDARVIVAFLCAQAVSSTLNFVGMRYLVFADRPSVRSRTAL